MPLTYEPGAEARIARITGTGEVTHADSLALLELQRRDLDLGLHMLIDHRKSELRMSVPESADLAHRYSDLYAGHYDPVSAVIATPAVGFGMARAFEGNLDDSRYYRIFTDAEEAEAWLRTRIAEESGTA